MPMSLDTVVGAVAVGLQAASHIDAAIRNKYGEGA
jgi:hypothetical protein